MINLIKVEIYIKSLEDLEKSLKNKIFFLLNIVRIPILF